MITYIIKSTVSLIVLYGFYHLFLRNHKILLFNRFFLILSLIFSVTIPLIIIPVKTNLALDNSFKMLAYFTGHIAHQKEFIKNNTPIFTYNYILIALYIIISSIFLARFTINISRIIKKIIKCKKIDNLKTSIILVQEGTLPYSFLKYIFLNQSDFENGKIDKKLLTHEEIHCLQNHSIDTILLELINVFFWFNPAIWLFRKEILLNHEYYADNKVLTNNDFNDYHQLLLNLVIQNNTNYMVSNFKYSLIKNRIIMMTKNKPSHNAILRKIAAISTFLTLAITLTFSQETKHKDNAINFQNEWWYPILKRYNIVPSDFNNFDRVFEMGSKNSINNRVVTLENAFILTKPDSDNGYYIIKSPLAYHDLNNNTIKGAEGTMERYNLKSEDIKAIQTYHFKDFLFKMGGPKPKFDLKNVEATVNIEKKK